MKSLFSQLIFGFILLCATHAHGGTCGPNGAPTWAMQHPSTLMNWMRGHGVRDVENFVCCLPQEYRSNFAVAHSSQAAQNGTPENPRVLMFNDLRGSKPLNMTLSINSGAASMHQADSVEIAFRNSRNGTLEYYDMNFGSGNPRLSNSNPASCTACHGQYGGQFAHGGARPLFRLGNRWPTFLGGTTRCHTPEDSIFQRASARATTALRTTPRFRCLDPRELGAGKGGAKAGVAIDGNERLHANLVRFSAALERSNSERAAALVMNQPGYNQYKYFLIGYEQCANVTAPGDWIPQQKISQLYARVKVLPQVRSAPTLRAAIEAGSSQVRANVTRLQAQLIRLPVRNVLRDGYQAAPTTFSCPTGEGRVSFPRSTADSPLNRIAVDNRLRSDNSDFQMSAALRLFYEGNGGDVTDLSMTPATEGASHNGATPVAGELLFRDPELSEYFNRRAIGQSGGGGESRMIFTARDVIYTSKFPVDRLCRMLAQKSLALFSTSSTSNSSRNQNSRR